MTTMMRARILALLVASSTLIAGAQPVCGQVLTPPPIFQSRPDAADPKPGTTALTQPSLIKPFVDGVEDLLRVPSRDNAGWLLAGLGAAAAIHGADRGVSSGWVNYGHQAFKPGAVIGGTPFELGAAFATYAIGRSTHSPRFVELGSDLIRSQVMAELMTVGVKQAVRRARPDGTSFSFPSGHTAAAFASATVLQQHFGWKVGIPAYAVGAYVAASRVQMKRHYLSDVAFGAALGIVAGRTVTINRRHRMVLTPAVTPGGGGAILTW